MNAIKIHMPPVDVIARRWVDVEKMLERATRTTRCYEPIDLLRAVMLGQMAMWFIECDGVVMAALVTEVKQYPRRRILEVPCMAGSGIEKWREPLRMALEAHADQFGCSHITCFGRKGWEKFGFEEAGSLWVWPLRKAST